MIGAKPGRPKKQRFRVPCGCASPLSALEIKQLRLTLLRLPQIIALPSVQAEQLITRLTEVTGFFRATAQLHRNIAGPKGNKPKRYISILLRDCCEAFAKATGSAQPVPLWENDTSQTESPAIEIARKCLTVATGTTYAASLRQQIKPSRKWVFG
jgi:hypothetical protein